MNRGRGRLADTIHFFICNQELIHPIPHARVVRANLIQVNRALRFLQVKGGLKDLLKLRMAFGTHALGSPI
jgi:hypothetical protein